MLRTRRRAGRRAETSRQREQIREKKKEVAAGVRGRHRSHRVQDPEEGTQLRRSGKLGGDHREPVEALQNEPQDPAGGVQKMRDSAGRGNVPE